VKIAQSVRTVVIDPAIAVFAQALARRKSGQIGLGVGGATDLLIMSLDSVSSHFVRERA
jgi:hypothetical protein